MLAELKTLFWLQWKLTVAMFRSTRLSVRWRMVGLLLQLFVFLFTIPMFIGMGTGLALVLMLLSPRAAYELVMLVNAMMFVFWLLLPASYSSSVMERFEVTRLFAHPVSFGGIVVGGTVMSLLTMTGLWTIPIILAEVIGLAWHAPLALPLILAGALSAFVALTLAGRLMDDLFDLVAGDRRLRAILLGVLTLPFMLCGFSNFFIQRLTENYEKMPDFLQQPYFEAFIRSFDAFEGVKNFGDLRAAFSGVLESLAASRLLAWLPGNWGTAAMGLATQGEWLPAMGFLLISLLFLALMLGAHAAVTRRLMAGAAVTLGAESVRSRFWQHTLPGSPVFWALFRKDWLNLLRNPLPRWLIIPSLLASVGAMFGIWGAGRSDVPETGQSILHVAALVLALTILSMITNLSLTANYYGVVDREGFATLAQAPVDGRFILLSSNLAVWVYAGLQVIILVIGVALAARSWEVLPVGLILGVCLQIGGAPAYNLAAMLGPYRAQLTFTKTDQQGNLWGFLAWIISAPPVLALVGLPYIFWKPALLVTLPLCLLYSIGLYALTLKPLARLAQSRAHAIFAAVLAEA
ncbi:MAG: hypothetical protein ACOYYS_17085 [Chloroflexota bacterium]